MVEGKQREEGIIGGTQVKYSPWEHNPVTCFLQLCPNSPFFLSSS